MSALKEIKYHLKQSYHKKKSYPLPYRTLPLPYPTPYPTPFPNLSYPYPTLPSTLPYPILLSILSYPTLPYPLPYHTLSYPTLYSTLPYPTLPYPNLPYPTLPYPYPYPILNRPVNLPSMYLSHVLYSLMSVRYFLVSFSAYSVPFRSDPLCSGPFR